MGEGRGEGDCAPKFELVCARALSTPFHKYNHVCGEGFLAQTRRERRAYPSGVCKERATKSGPKRTAARRVASLFGSGFVAPRSQPHCGGCSLVAPRQNRKSTQQTWPYLWNGVLSQHLTCGSPMEFRIALMPKIP